MTEITQGDYYLIKSLGDFEKRMPAIVDRLGNWDYSTPCTIKLEKFQGKKTLNQLALVHMWFRAMSITFIKKQPDATPEGCKWMMKHKFGPRKNIKVGSTEVKDQLVSLRDLDKGEMCYFMDQVLHWATERDLYLPMPDGNEYTTLKREQNS
tara:strand:+ start:2070 stop:2525 length:456 start_codon:yes stop_codon:yes gene_type:complete